MKELKIDDLSYILPNNGLDINSMDESEKNEYIQLYNAYRSLFSAFIIKKFELKKYDDMIFNSGIKFPTVIIFIFKNFANFLP